MRLSEELEAAYVQQGEVSARHISLAQHMEMQLAIADAEVATTRKALVDEILKNEQADKHKLLRIQYALNRHARPWLDRPPRPPLKVVRELHGAVQEIAHIVSGDEP